MEICYKQAKKLAKSEEFSGLFHWGDRSKEEQNRNKEYSQKARLDQPHH